MVNLRLKDVIALGFAGLFLCGCEHAEAPLPKAQEHEQARIVPQYSPPPSSPQSYAQDLLKTQHEALDKAKALNDQLQQRAMEQAKAIEAAEQ